MSFIRTYWPHLLLVILSFAATWLAQGWRYEAEIADIQRAQAVNIAAAHQDNELLTADLAASSRNHYQKMQEKLHENADLATALAAGRLQLHLAESVIDTGDSTGGGLVARPSCALNAAGRQAYLDLRAGIIRNEAQIEALQERNRILEAQGR